MGVKPAVQWIVIFRVAGGTLFEPSHGRVWAIVRNFLDYAESRPAVRAVRKRIAISPVRRIQEFSQAIRTNRDIWQNERCLWARIVAIPNLEALMADNVEVGGFQALDNGQGRLLLLQPGHELLKKIKRAFDLDKYTLRRI